MIKGKKNSFEKICDKLEENNILGENEITYVRKYFISDLKISDDKDMLLKLKAEAEDSDYKSYYSFIISILAMFFSAIGIIVQLFPETPDMVEVISFIKIIYLIIITIFLFLCAQKFSNKKYKSVIKWGKYVLIIINELIEKRPEGAEHNLIPEQSQKQSINTIIDKSKRDRGKKR